MISKAPCFSLCRFCFPCAVSSPSVFLQANCGGEGCSQGLPGVPGMAGAKEEKGDSGKPGVTPMDSCDRVRLLGGSLWDLQNDVKRD